MPDHRFRQVIQSQSEPLRNAAEIIRTACRTVTAHDLFDQYPNQACWRFALRDQKRPQVLLDSVLQVHIIELRKAERLRKLPAPLRAWIACLLHTLNEAAMNAITYPPVKEALQHLEQMYAEEDLRLAAERRQQALIDDQNALAWALHEGEKSGLEKGEQIGLEKGEQIGLEKGERIGLKKGQQIGLQKGEQLGLQKGIQQGIQQGMQQQRKTLLSMLEHKFGALPPSFQVRLENADAQQLQAWSLGLLDAQRIEDVFA